MFYKCEYLAKVFCPVNYVYKAYQPFHANDSEVLLFTSCMLPVTYRDSWLLDFSQTLTTERTLAEVAGGCSMVVVLNFLLSSYWLLLLSCFGVCSFRTSCYM